MLPSWGTVTDPAGDCSFTADDGKLTIGIPADCATAHNLCAELDNMNAPRVLTAVNGDFDLEVKVEAAFAPGTRIGAGSRVPYQGAGLTVIADHANYIRLERASMLFDGHRDYINFEIRVDGHLERFGSNEKFPLDATRPVWLRLERRGHKMRGGMRQEGGEWAWGESKALESAAWAGERLETGVHAACSSMAAFAPVFSELKREAAKEDAAGQTEPPTPAPAGGEPLPEKP